MIARWMLAATAFSLLAAFAAFGAERALRALRRQARMTWCIALGVAVAWPIAALLFLTRSPEPVFAADVVMGTPVPLGATAQPSGMLAWQALLDGAWLDSPWLNGLLQLAWATSSGVLLLLLARASWMLRRLRAASCEAVVDGEPVLVTETVGPAAIGLARARIVVPSWLTELDAPLRGLVLRHEREHCRARDPMVMWLAALASALVPWNVGVWWIVRRLRLAMEVDCDARTLPASADAEERVRYARVLLLIAQRKGAARLAPTLVHTPSQLARRIAAMHAVPSRHPVARAAAALAGTAVCIAAACSPRVANELAGPAQGNSAAEVASVAAAPASSIGTDVPAPPAPPEEPQTPPAPQVPAPVLDLRMDKFAVLAPGTRGPVYPPAMRAAGTSGEVLAQFVVEPDGRVDVSSFRVLRTAHAEFTTAVMQSLAETRFLPAEKGGRKVRQLVQMPFVFRAGAERGESPPAIGQIRPRSRDAVHQVPPMVTTVPGAARESASPTVVPADMPLFDFQTESPAMPVAGTRGPTYPEALRASRTRGDVLVQVVVDENGRAMMPSLKVLRSDHDLFAAAVKESLGAMEFTPAKVGGKAVRQLVQLPFTFSP